MQQNKQIRYQVTLDAEIKDKAEEKALSIGLKLNDVIRVLTTNFANDLLSISVTKPEPEFIGYEVSQDFKSQLKEAENEYKKLPRNKRKSYKNVIEIMSELDD